MLINVILTFNVERPFVNCVLSFFSPTPLIVSDGQTDGQEETPAQQQARMSASSATRELDELMASLSDFKVQSNVSMLLRRFWVITFAYWMEDVYCWHCATVEDCAARLLNSL